MTQTTYYKNRAVRSPIQPHPVQKMRQKMQDTNGNAEHPVRQTLRKLCANQLRLCVSFSEDIGALSTIKVPGLLAVRCVISDENGKPLGIGYSSSYLTRINRQHERTLFSILNGSLLSGMNVVCKTLDAIRLEKSDEETSSSYMLGEAYQARDAAASSIPATDRQKKFLRELAASRMDESAAENFLASIEEMTREEASAAISRWT